MAQNIEATSSTPEYLGQYMRDDVAKWAGVVKAAGVKPE
jgi:tripartite-type tricarboxylate transporter receptor subunit TctC